MLFCILVFSWEESFHLHYKGKIDHMEISLSAKRCGIITVGHHGHFHWYLTIAYRLNFVRKRNIFLNARISWKLHLFGYSELLFLNIFQSFTADFIFILIILSRFVFLSSTGKFYKWIIMKQTIICMCCLLFYALFIYWFS